MLGEEKVKKNEIALGITSVLVAFVSKFVVLGIVESIFVQLGLHLTTDILIEALTFFILFVIVSSILIKKMTVPTFLFSYEVVRFLGIRKMYKIKDSEKLGVRHLNLLVPSVTISLLIFDIFDFFNSLFNDHVPALIISFVLLIVFFMLSLSIAENVGIGS